MIEQSVRFRLQSKGSQKSVWMGTSALKLIICRILFKMNTLSSWNLLLTFQLVSTVKSHSSFNQFVSERALRSDGLSVGYVLKIQFTDADSKYNTIAVASQSIHTRHLSLSLSPYLYVCILNDINLGINRHSITLYFFNDKSQPIRILRCHFRPPLYVSHPSLSFVLVKNALEYENRIKCHLFCLNVIHRYRMQRCSLFCLT